MSAAGVSRLITARRAEEIVYGIIVERNFCSGRRTIFTTKKTLNDEGETEVVLHEAKRLLMLKQ